MRGLKDACHTDGRLCHAVRMDKVFRCSSHNKKTSLLNPIVTTVQTYTEPEFEEEHFRVLSQVPFIYAVVVYFMCGALSFPSVWAP